MPIWFGINENANHILAILNVVATNTNTTTDAVAFVIVAVAPPKTFQWYTLRSQSHSFIR